jgi:acid phosphatase type 7
MSTTQRHVGLPPVVASKQLSKSFPTSGLQPLPPGSPARVTPEKVGIADPGETITFAVIGDHGAIKGAAGNAVSYALQGAGITWPFIWSVGDIVYYHGDPDHYLAQFYEQYAHCASPIVGHPGNHDGDVAVDDAGNATGRGPLDTFMANFCDTQPTAPSVDPGLEFGRHTQTQPYCDWTLELAAVTIIAVYTNVPEGGHLAESQTAWLRSELAATPADRRLVVSLHHPPLSVDAHHGGSSKMRQALSDAFASADRYPDMILTGHVHNFQHFTWNLAGHAITTVVQGNSGYPNKHRLASDAVPGLDVNGDGSVIFEYGDASAYGFTILTVDSPGNISAEYVQVTPGSMPDGSDATVTRHAHDF